MSGTATRILVLATVALTAMAGVHAQDSNDMARCAGLENADARLACYDEVAGRSRPPVQDGPAPLTQDVGQEQLDDRNRPESEPTIVEGRVTSCQKDANGKWYFVFDNGQVWKQRNDRRPSSGECDFSVTITQDFFGYKMRIEGEQKWIRIGRVR